MMIKGIALLLLGKYNNAIVMFNKAIELNPNLAQAFQSKGVLYINIQRQFTKRFKRILRGDKNVR